VFGFILQDSIFEWGRKYVQNHPNCTCEKLQQAFYKRSKTMKNDEEVIAKHTTTNR
jgi:hypothetical protein